MVYGDGRMRYLVTGGAGFIGSWIAELLLQEPDNEVIVLDDFSTGSTDNLPRKYGKRLSVVHNDIRKIEAIRKSMKGVDACFHLAARVFVDESIAEPALYEDVNVKGTINVLESAREFDAKVVFASTCLIYNRTQKQAISEEHPLKSASPYAASKIAAENFVQSFNYAYQLPTAILRPFNTYGPRQSAGAYGGVIARFIRSALINKPLPLYGNGKQTRDFLYVEDCAKAFIMAASEKKANGEIINIGSGKDITIKDLGSLILSLISSKSRLTYVKHPHPQSEIMKLLCNSTKAKHLLGWIPATSLRKGLLNTIKWLKGSSEAT